MSTRFRPLLLRALTVLVTSLGVAQAATSLSVAPLSIALLGRQTSGQTAVRNVSDRTGSFRVDVYAWTQDGEEKLAPSRDIIVNPPTFTLRPDQSQIIRVAVRGALPPSERAYRLVLQELPSKDEGTAPPSDQALIQVETLYRFVLPLFVEPVRAAAQVSFALERGPNGPALVARNTGGLYATIVNMTFAANGRTSEPLSFNLLAGGTLRFPLAEWGDVSSVELNYEQFDKPQRLTLGVKP